MVLFFTRNLVPGNAACQKCSHKPNWIGTRQAHTAPLPVRHGVTSGSLVRLPHGLPKGPGQVFMRIRATLLDTRELPTYDVERFPILSEEGALKKLRTYPWISFSSLSHKPAISSLVHTQIGCCKAQRRSHFVPAVPHACLARRHRLRPSPGSNPHYGWWTGGGR